MKMEITDSRKFPNQKELERELSEFLSKKYGNRVKIISPFILPKGKELPTQEGRDAYKKKGMPDFDMLPEELESYLDNFIIKQDQAKTTLATKICTHFNRAKRFGKGKKNSAVGMIKNNILLIGPTGVGKTYIIKLIAKRLGVPFVKGDATKFSETGYVGGDVEDLVRDLVYEADDNIELAEYGIIYLDEIDKIASSKNIIGHDVSRTGVQRALLKPMEETEVDLRVPHDPISQIQAIEHYRRTGKRERRVINTKNILFVMSGAFNGLAEIIRKRLQRQGIGFEADVVSKEVSSEILKEVTAQDLIEFGFETEFIGRLPVIVVFEELKKDDLVEILKNPNNPVILSKKYDFGAYDIDIKFEPEALEKIAERAAQERTGARGLVSVIEKVLIPFEKTLPSTDIKRLLVTPEMIEDPEGELKLLLDDPENPEREERYERAAEFEFENIKGFIEERIPYFSQVTGMQLYKKRIEIIARLYLKTITDIETACEEFKEMRERIIEQGDHLSDRMEIIIRFDESAIDEIISRSIDSGEDPEDLTFQLINRLEYGLKLVREKTGRDEFIIDAKAITDMENYINELVQNYYREQYKGFER